MLSADYTVDRGQEVIYEEPVVAVAIVFVCAALIAQFGIEAQENLNYLRPTEDSMLDSLSNSHEC